MNVFSWGHTYETGLKEVDDQHQILVNIINRLGREISENDKHSIADNTILQELISYAQQHFEDEEDLMNRFHLDSRHVNQHILEHSAFLNDVLAMVEQLHRNRPGMDKSLLDFLTNWLAYHILGVDQNMSRQIRAIKEGTLPHDAYQAEERNAANSTEPLLVALSGLFKMLSSRNRELVWLNRNLEEKVIERTEELLKANEDLEILALTDSLTELPNRRHGMRQLSQLWEECNGQVDVLSCMMIDADNFKTINDTYGHDAGDVVLKMLARELHHSVRSDDIVCRLGGDEFLVICPLTPLDGAMYVAEQVRTTVASLNIEVGEGVWHGSISVGVAANLDGISSVDDLLKAADEGVYDAKKAGRNCVRSRQIGT